VLAGIARYVVVVVIAALAVAGAVALFAGVHVEWREEKWHTLETWCGGASAPAGVSFLESVRSRIYSAGKHAATGVLTSSIGAPAWWHRLEEWLCPSIAETEREPLVVVGDFSIVDKRLFAPLVVQWGKEGIAPYFVDVKDIVARYDGRDDAEKLRNYLKVAHEENGLKYVFLVDVVLERDDGWGRNTVPVRVFQEIPEVEPTAENWYPARPATWNDFYYANLTGNFDVDGDGMFVYHPNDVSGMDSYDVVVGRLILYYPNHSEQLAEYVKANIEYRTAHERLATFIIYRYYNPDYVPLDGFTVPFVDNLLRQMRSYGFEVYPKVYDYENIGEVYEAISDTSFVYFAGHGSWLGQQVGYAGDNQPVYIGTYLRIPHIVSFGPVSRPFIAVFKGCNTAAAYNTDTGRHGRLTVATAMMSYLKPPVVGMMANTTYGVTFGRNDREILRLAENVPFAEAILLRQTAVISEDTWWGLRLALTYQYFGDPTLRLFY